MRRAHRLLLLQGLAVAAVVWMSTGHDAAAKTKKKSKHHKHPAASASASASVAPSASAADTAPSASAAASSEPAASAAASTEPVASAAPSETTPTPDTTPAPAAASDSSADTGTARPTFRDVMLEGVGGLIFGAVPLLAGSGGLLVLGNGSGDKTPAYIGLGAATYGVFIPMTALGVAFAGNLLDVHGTYLGALLGSAIGTALAAAPTAVLVYEGTRGASVDGVEVVSGLYAFPMVLGTLGAVIGWELSASKAPKTTAARRWVVPGVTPSPYGTMFTLSGAF
jgi:hypothetical protein